MSPGDPCPGPPWGGPQGCGAAPGRELTGRKTTRASLVPNTKTRTQRQCVRPTLPRPGGEGQGRFTRGYRPPRTAKSARTPVLSCLWGPLLVPSPSLPSPEFSWWEWGWLENSPGRAHPRLFFPLGPDPDPRQPAPRLKSHPAAPVSQMRPGKKARLAARPQLGSTRGRWRDPQREGRETEAPFALCFVLFTRRCAHSLEEEGLLSPGRMDFYRAFLGRKADFRGSARGSGRECAELLGVFFVDPGFLKAVHVPIEV